MSAEEPDYNNIKAVSGDPKIITWPGEYEVAGIAITAQELSPEKSSKKTEKPMLFMFDADNLKVCYLTDLSVTFTEEMVENIGEVDVLLVPVGGEKNGYKQAHQLIEDLEPRAVIPMHYKTPGLKIELEGLENFAKQAGLTSYQPRDKFVLNSKNDLPEDKTEFIILKPQTD